MKSSKIANAKFLAGIVIALALIIMFACEQKEALKLPPSDNEDYMKLTLVEGRIKIEGSFDELEKVRSMFSNNSGFKVETDSFEHYLLINCSSEPQTIEGEPIFFIVEQMPEFPGGEKALKEFIAKSVEYPPIAHENGIQGRVYVTFVVAKDGTIANAEIARGVDPSLDKEALRVINALPEWNPGYQQGVPVHVKYTVPINFALQ